MVLGSAIARDVAPDVLTDSNFTEAAIYLRATEGHRNQYGEWVAGADIETAVNLVEVPITGQERLTLEEGLRDEDVRTFYVQGDVAALRAGLTDGDRFVLGGLGASQNRFDGTDRQTAERARDTYATANPLWFGGYQSSVAALIQLRGFGENVYERYDATDGHWIEADVYRAYRPRRWGAFTQVMCVRQDPGV